MSESVLQKRVLVLGLEGGEGRSGLADTNSVESFYDFL